MRWLFLHGGVHLGTRSCCLAQFFGLFPQSAAIHGSSAIHGSVGANIDLPLPKCKKERIVTQTFSLFVLVPLVLWPSTLAFETGAVRENHFGQ